MFRKVVVVAVAVLVVVVVFSFFFATFYSPVRWLFCIPVDAWTFRFCVLYFLQKDIDHAVVVAVAAHAVFEPGPEGGDELYSVGVASTLLKVKFGCFSPFIEQRFIRDISGLSVL